MCGYIYDKRIKLYSLATLKAIEANADWTSREILIKSKYIVYSIVSIYNIYVGLIETNKWSIDATASGDSWTSTCTVHQ